MTNSEHEKHILLVAPSREWQEQHYDHKQADLLWAWYKYYTGGGHNNVNTCLSHPTFVNVPFQHLNQEKNIWIPSFYLVWCSCSPEGEPLDFSDAMTFLLVPSSEQTLHSWLSEYNIRMLFVLSN